MEVFEKLSEDLLKHDIRVFKPWLHSVVRNHCLMQLRKQKKIHQVLPDTPGKELELVEMNARWHHQEDESKEAEYAQLEAGIRSLNESQRVCVELFYLKENTYQQICERTGYSFQQVKSHIQNGKRNLKIFLQQNHEK